jgi:sirohydrochlorin ferrochelatase
VAQIVEAAKQKNPGLRVAITEPLGNHPGLLAVLAERVEEGMGAAVV